LRTGSTEWPTAWTTPFERPLALRRLAELRRLDWVRFALVEPRFEVPELRAELPFELRVALPELRRELLPEVLRDLRAGSDPFEPAAVERDRLAPVGLRLRAGDRCDPRVFVSAISIRLSPSKLPRCPFAPCRGLPTWLPVNSGIIRTVRNEPRQERASVATKARRMISALMMLRRLLPALRYAVREEELGPIFGAGVTLVVIGTDLCAGRELERRRRALLLRLDAHDDERVRS
jgi:hypothetical protein